MKRRAPQLASGRSPRWAFMEKFEIPDYDHPERNYLTRWRLIQTPWFGIYLHRMDGPDPRPTLHDHPWGFTSLILRGGYQENRLDTLTRSQSFRIVQRVNLMRKDDAHYISDLLRVPTWTLVFVGRRVRTWGYLQPAPTMGEWTWTEFTQHRYAKEFDRALEARTRSAHR